MPLQTDINETEAINTNNAKKGEKGANQHQVRPWLLPCVIKDAFRRTPQQIISSHEQIKLFPVNIFSQDKTST